MAIRGFETSMARAMQTLEAARTRTVVDHTYTVLMAGIEAFDQENDGQGARLIWAPEKLPMFVAMEANQELDQEAKGVFFHACVAASGLRSLMGALDVFADELEGLKPGNVDVALWDITSVIGHRMATLSDAALHDRVINRWAPSFEFALFTARMVSAFDGSYLGVDRAELDLDEDVLRLEAVLRHGWGSDKPFELCK